MNYSQKDKNSSKNTFYNANEGFIKGNLQIDIYDKYKNYTPVEPKVKDEKEALLLFIQKSGFAAHDLNLYLDTHPNDQHALDLYHFYVKEYDKAVNQYQEKFGPLMVNDMHMSKIPFAWINGKWPWEGR